MSFPKHKYLLSYRYSELVHDLTVQFCREFFRGDVGTLNYLSAQRTIAQMDHAARSGKQNIVEGVGQSAISKKGEIKLLGVAKASLEELITDFEDFLRQRKFEIWDKNDPRVKTLRLLGFAATELNSPKELMLPKSPIEAANLMLTLCHQCTFLLDRQIQAAEKKFLEEGGYTESLYKRRVATRASK